MRDLLLKDLVNDLIKEKDIPERVKEHLSPSTTTSGILNRESVPEGMVLVSENIEVDMSGRRTITRTYRGWG